MHRTNARRRRIAVAGALPAALIAALLTAAPSSAESPPALEGAWQGTLQGALRIVLNLERGEGGVLRGTMDSPDQGAMGLAIDTTWASNDTLHFEWRRLRASYEAVLSADGRELTGAWKQSGFTLPLSLRRLDQPPDYRKPQEPVKPYPYDEEEVSYENRAAGVKLAGTLTRPRGQGRFPCALLITGSGAEDRDESVFGHRPFLVLADHLTREGIAVLRVDDRGVGGSTGSTASSTSEDFAGDVAAGVAFLKARSDIDPRRIGLIGHSEGGLIAPLVATRSRDVAFIVLMAGPGLPGDSTLLLQNAALRRTMGASEENIARELAASRRIYAGLRRDDSTAVARATRELVGLQLAGLPEAQRQGAGDPDSIASRATRQLYAPWMRFFLTYDPRPALRRLKCPVLAINGEKDLQVLPKENLDAIQAALAAGGNPDYTVKELPGLNHLFQTCETGSIGEYARIQETIAPAALEEMSSWILEHTAKR
jgi:pimeloyl-ACP methyl ester carboxylesterase